MSKPSLRDAMPQTATFIDFAREAFGADAINAEIKKGMAGLPGHFHATENGQTAGTPFADRGGWVSLAETDVTPTMKAPHADRNHRR
jgi:hypothetical protein